MSNSNIGWLFYKDYFFENDKKGLRYKDNLLKQDIKNKENEISELKKQNPYQRNEINLLKQKIDDIVKQVDDIVKHNEEILETKTKEILKQTINSFPTPLVGKDNFELITLYPGLLIGSGYNHELHIKNEFQLGFQFDYTSGLPVIPASSIKGLLKSSFKHQDYIKELLNKNDIDIKELEKEIFEGQDVFFDAFISKGDKDNKILADDYITPHKDNPLKNPTPLRFLKVRPEVTFKFSFHLKNGIIDCDKKCELFKRIILDLGLGAKTNVGYGQFKKHDNNKKNTLNNNQIHIINKTEMNSNDDKNIKIINDILSKNLGDIVNDIKENKIPNDDNIKINLLKEVLEKLEAALKSSKLNEKSRKKYEEQHIPFIKEEIKKLDT
jgi:CRISPR-associated protein Cmr6